MPPPRLEQVECGGLIFDSNFDSGNCASVEQLDHPDRFAVWTSPDAAGTPHETGLRTWFLDELSSWWGLGRKL